MLSLFSGMDVAVTRTLNGLAGASVGLDELLVLVTSLGVPAIILAVALQWWRRGERDHVRHVIVASGLSFVLGLGLNQLVLLFVHRLRPYDSGVTHLLIAPSADWSFPSDHATAAMAVAAAFLLGRMPKTGLALLAAALLMMVSRVYVGTHYTSDVLGGAITGVAAALAVWALYREGTKLDRLVTRIL